MTDEQYTFSADSPLEKPEDDLLGYAPFAEMLAKSITEMIPADGLVIAINGEWGSGKSTVLNFIENYLDDKGKDEQPIIVRFNPWWFSGSENLLYHFFDELGSELSKDRFRGAVQNLVALTKGISYVISKVSIGSEVPYAIASQIPGFKEKSLNDLRNETMKASRDLKRRILIIIDDIDRLDPDEIRQLFTVIKAVANFPNVIYLLAFDEIVVSRTIGNLLHTSGFDYLEKIVQVSFHLPPPDQEALKDMVLGHLKRIMGKLHHTVYDKEFYLMEQGVVIDILPLFKTPRDVNRFTNALSVTYPAVRGEVNDADFITLEAIRIFMSDLYHFIRREKVMFTRVNLSEEQSRQIASQVNNHDDKETRSKLVINLFPQLDKRFIGSPDMLITRRNNLRLCSPDIFDTYFRLSLPGNKISLRRIKELLLLAADEQEFTAAWRKATDDYKNNLEKFLKYFRQYLPIPLLQPLQTIPEINARNMIETIMLYAKEVAALGSRPITGFTPEITLQIRIIHLLLLHIHARSERFEIVNSWISKRDNLPLSVLLVYWLWALYKEYHDPPPIEEPMALSEEQIEILEGKIYPQVVEITSQNDFFEEYELNPILTFWAGIDAAEMQDWLIKRLHIPKDLVSFIRSHTLISSHRGIKSINLPEMDKHIKSDSLLQVIDEVIASDQLNNEQLQIVTEFRKMLLTAINSGEEQ